MNDYTLVLIEWEDSAQPLSAWRFIENLPALEVVGCTSVGFLINENDRVVMLSPNLGNVDSGDELQGSGFIRIPKIAITKRSELVIANKNNGD